MFIRANQIIHRLKLHKTVPQVSMRVRIQRQTHDIVVISHRFVQHVMQILHVVAVRQVPEHHTRPRVLPRSQFVDIHVLALAIASLFLPVPASLAPWPPASRCSASLPSRGRAARLPASLPSRRHAAASLSAGRDAAASLPARRHAAGLAAARSAGRKRGRRVRGRHAALGLLGGQFDDFLGKRRRVIGDEIGGRTDRTGERGGGEGVGGTGVAERERRGEGLRVDGAVGTRDRSSDRRRAITLTNHLRSRTHAVGLPEPRFVHRTERINIGFRVERLTFHEQVFIDKGSVSRPIRVTICIGQIKRTRSCHPFTRWGKRR